MSCNYQIPDLERFDFGTQPQYLLDGELLCELISVQIESNYSGRMSWTIYKAWSVKHGFEFEIKEEGRVHTINSRFTPYNPKTEIDDNKGL